MQLQAGGGRGSALPVEKRKRKITLNDKLYSLASPGLSPLRLHPPPFFHVFRPGRHRHHLSPHPPLLVRACCRHRSTVPGRDVLLVVREHPPHASVRPRSRRIRGILPRGVPFRIIPLGGCLIQGLLIRGSLLRDIRIRGSDGHRRLLIHQKCRRLELVCRGFVRRRGLRRHESSGRVHLAHPGPGANGDEGRLDFLHPGFRLPRIVRPFLPLNNALLQPDIPHDRLLGPLQQFLVRLRQEVGPPRLPGVHRHVPQLLPVAECRRHNGPEGLPSWQEMVVAVVVHHPLILEVTAKPDRR